MPTDAYLIIEQQSSPLEGMPELLKELASVHNLDSYSCRQHLLGQGQALLTKGQPEQLTKISHSLTKYEVRNYVLTPSRLKFAPFILSRIETSTNELRLYGREKHLLIPRGARLLILLADLSGSLAKRNLSQILSSHRYRGTTENAALPAEKWQRTILQGRPILDIYLLDDNGIPQGAVRALPGKFDHRGLAERATLSARQNLLKLSELVQEFTAHCRVDMRFGLSHLPGASLQVPKDNDLEGLKKTLRNLTRYAWLQTDIDHLRIQTAKRSDDAAIAVTTTSLLTATQPELATNLPLQQELITELTSEISAATKKSAPKDSPASPPPTLPTPPPIEHHSIWNNPRTIGAILIMVLIGLLTHFGHRYGWLEPLAAKAFSSGSISGLLAAGFFTGGFRLLRMKRLIENTPTSKVRSIAMGRVEVHGTARRQYALISPMSNIACIYYRLIRYKRNYKNNWVISSISSSGHVPFWLEDETGRVSVDPNGAKIKSGHRQESFGGGSVAFGGAQGADEKWVEEIIYDGALVYVLGEAQVKKSARLPRQQRRAAALRHIKQDTQKLTSYDSNSDGRIDESEWQAVRDEVDDQLLREDLAGNSQLKRQEDQVVIKKPRHRGVPYMISETASEAKLIRRYGLTTGLLFTAAGACCLLTVWLLLKYF